MRRMGGGGIAGILADPIVDIVAAGMAKQGDGQAVEDVLYRMRI